MALVIKERSGQSHPLRGIFFQFVHELFSMIPQRILALKVGRSITAFWLVFGAGRYRRIAWPTGLIWLAGMMLPGKGLRITVAPDGQPLPAVQATLVVGS